MDISVTDKMSYPMGNTKRDQYTSLFLGSQDLCGPKSLLTDVPHSEVRMPSQPEHLEGQPKFARQPTLANEYHTRANIPNDARDLCSISRTRAAMTPGGSSHFQLPPPYSPSLSPPPGEIGLVMPRPSATESYNMVVSSIPSQRLYDFRKWLSADDYLRAIGLTPPLLLGVDAQRATATRPVNSVADKPANSGGTCSKSAPDIEDPWLSSDIDSEAEDSSAMLTSSAPTPDTTVHCGISKGNTIPAVDELRNIKDELQKLLGEENSREDCQLQGLVETFIKLGRDRALKEVSKALRDRASAKFTVGKSERLILEREADLIFRMNFTSSATASQHLIDTQYPKRQDRRKAIREAVDGLFATACALLQEN